jgi:hypothetical protein
MHSTVPEKVRRAAIATNKAPVTAAGPSHKQHLSPKKLLKRIFHPHRSEENTAGDRGHAKRLRAGDAEDAVIVVDSDSDEAGPSHQPEYATADIDFVKILKMFRLPASKLA